MPREARDTGDETRRDEATKTGWSRYLDLSQARLIVAAIYGIVLGSAVAGANYWLFGAGETIGLSGVLAAVGAMAFILYWS